MFSTESQPGPSSPSKPSSPLRADEPLELGETQASSFSIRDYVLNYRSKDIATSWPFSQKFLKLCLKHGVRDILPPFEPPDRVRDQCLHKAEETEKPASLSGAEEVSGRFDSADDANNIKSKTSLISDELAVGCSDQARFELPETQDISDNQTSSEANVETVSAVTNQEQIERATDKSSELIPCPGQVTRRNIEEPLRIKVRTLHPLRSKLGTLHELHHSSNKKCRSVRFRSTAEISRPEERSSLTSTVSDPMASKVCPVCKVFASTSNTTLNAHIDQCLSADSTVEKVVTKIQEPKLKLTVEKAVTKIQEPKVKPIKKRLMVDIYTTAPHCTLKDLDERNGTNWATELAVTAPPSEPCNEIKRLKLSPDDTREEEKPAEVRQYGNEGAVYVDSNGIKLCILSKFNDTPPLIPRKHLELKKHAKNKDDCTPLIRKKKCFGSKYSKYMKVKTKSMKLSSSESFKDEIQAPVEEDCDVNTYMEREESPSEMPNTHDQIKGSCSGTLKPWVCSKRSDLPKKLNDKDLNNSRFKGINQPDISNSSSGKCHIKFSSPLEDLTSSPKTKRIDLLSNNARTKKSGKNLKPPVFISRWSSKSTSTGIMLKKCRSMGTPSSFPDRREDTHIRAQPKFGNACDRTSRSPWSSHLQLKTKKSLSMNENVLFRKQIAAEGSHGNVTNTTSTPKKFQKCRSILGTGNKGERPSELRRGCHSRKRCDLDSVRTKKLRTPPSDLSPRICRPTSERSMCRKSPSDTNISESEDGDDAFAMKNKKYKRLKWPHSDVECDDSESAPSDMQAELLSCSATLTKSSMEKAVVSAFPQNPDPTSSTKLDRWPSLDENMNSACESDASAEQSSENMCNKEAVQCHSVSHEEMNSRSIRLSDNEGFGGEGSASAVQFNKSRAGAGAVETTACLTSYAAHDIPLEIASVATYRRTSTHHQNLSIDRDRSGSPVSTATTMSPSSHRDSEFKNPIAEPYVRPIVQDKSVSEIPSAASLDGSEGRPTEIRVREAKALCPTKGSDNSSDDQPCCCSRNVGLAGQSQLSKQQRVLPSEGKWLSHLYITGNASPSLNPLPNARADVSVTPVLESPTESVVTTRASVDSAMKVMTSTDLSSSSPSPRLQTQSTPNSILRLMGKNLMVMNKEESTQMPTVCNSPETPSSAQCSRTPLFPTSNWDCYPYHQQKQQQQQQQLPGSSAVFGHAPSLVRHQAPLHSSNTQVGGYPSSWSAGPSVRHDPQIHHMMITKLSHPSACTAERTTTSHHPPLEFMSSPQATMMREVVVIDDSRDYPDLRCSRPNPVSVPPSTPTPYHLQQRQFAQFPSEVQCFPRDGNNSMRHHPNVCPMDYTNNMMQGNNSGVPQNLPPMPFAFQPPPMGRLRPPFFYSPALR